MVQNLTAETVNTDTDILVDVNDYHSCSHCF